MGFVLLLLYIITYYLTPATVFGPLAPFHLEMILAVLILFVSLPRLIQSFVFKTPQAWALAGLTLSVFLAGVFGQHWLGGAVYQVLFFLPAIYAYFFVCVHTGSRPRIDAIVLALLFVCCFVIARGLMELSHNPNAVIATETGSASEGRASGQSTQNGYLLAMKSDDGTVFYRLRGLGEINDPNDFAQLIVCVIPLMFVFWRPKKRIWNLVCVAVPVSVLVYGLYMTHSRGGIVAVAAVLVVALRRRIGTLPALIPGGALLAAAVAFNATGGRDISVDAGADRTALWSDSMQILKAHPVFGIGQGQLPDYLGHTAHNSILVCAVELGLFGFYFWCLFLLPTLRDVMTSAASSMAGGNDNRKAEAPSTSLGNQGAGRLGFVLLLSLSGFLVAGMFLSRALVLTLFLLAGLVEAGCYMSGEDESAARRWKLSRLTVYSAGFSVLLLATMYLGIRLVHMIH